MRGILGGIVLAALVLEAYLTLANGVVLGRDERHLYVAESGSYRVWKFPVDADGLALSMLPAAAQAVPQARVVLDSLPG